MDMYLLCNMKCYTVHICDKNITFALAAQSKIANNSNTKSHKLWCAAKICKYISNFHNLHEDAIELVMFTKDVVAILRVN